MRLNIYKKVHLQGNKNMEKMRFKIFSVMGKVILYLLM